MKNVLYAFCWVLFPFGIFVVAQEDAKITDSDNSNDTRPETKVDVEILDTGIRFYGNINFECGDGELSVVSNLNGTEIVPLGAVLCAIKKNYVLGYYKGAISVKNGEDVKRIDKVFFTVQRDGNVKFYYPGSDPNFIGNQIAGEVHF